MARGSDPGFRVIVSLTDRFTRPIKNVNDQIAQSTSKIRAWAAVPGAVGRSLGFDKIGSAIGNVGTQLGNVRSAITGLLGPFARLGVLAGGIGLVKFGTDAVSLAGDLVKLEHATNISVEALQGLRYAAEQSGVSADELGVGLTRLNKNIRDALKGGKSAKEIQEVFTKGLRIPLQELQKMKPDEVFLRAARAISQMTNETYKQETAFKLFGKGGTAMLALLNEGEAGIQKFADALRESGAFMDRDMVYSMKGFGDMMLEVRKHFEGVAYEVLKELLPSLRGAAEAMRDFIKEHKADIVKEVTAAVRGFVDIAKAAYTIIRDNVVPAVQSLKPVWEAFEAIVGKGNARLILFTALVAPKLLTSLLGLGGALLGLGKAVAAPLITGLTALVGQLSVLSGLSFGATAGGLLGLAAIIGLVGYGIWKNWGDIKKAFTEELPAAFADAGQRLKKGFEELPEQAANWPGEIQRLVTEPIKQADVKGPFEQLGDNIKDAATGAWGGITDAWNFVWNGFTSEVAEDDALETALTSNIEQIEVEGPFQRLGTNLSEAWSGLTGIFDTGVGWVRDALGDWEPQVVGALNIDSVPADTEGGWRSITAAFSTGIGWVKGAIRGWQSDIVDPLSIDQVPAESETTWQKIKKVFTDNIEDVKQFWRDLPGTISGFVTDIGAAFTNKAGELRIAIVDALTGPIKWVKDQWNSFVNWFRGTILGQIIGETSKLGAPAKAPGEAWTPPTTSTGGYITPPAAQPATVAPGAAPPVEPPAVAPQATGPAKGGGASNWGNFNPLNWFGGGGGGGKSTSEVTVDFRNVPEGTRVSQGRSTGDTDLTTNVAYRGAHAAAGSV